MFKYLQTSIKQYPWVYLIILITVLVYIHLQTQQVKEGLCIIGCKKKSRTRVNIDNTIMNTIINEFFSKQLQQHQASAAAVNAINIEGVKGTLRITDTKMKAFADVSLKSWQKMQSDQEVRALVETALKKSVVAETRTETGALGGLLGQATDTKTNIDLKNEIIDETVNRISVEQINQCIATAHAENVLNIKDAEGDVFIEGLEMDATAKTAADCLGDQIINQVTDVSKEFVTEDDVDVEIETEEKSIFESIFGGIFEGLGSLALYGIIGLVALIVIIVIIVILYWTLGGNNGNADVVLPRTTEYPVVI